ncbi:MAG: glycosyltransferase family 4 protein [Candidatus Pacebacteria bacterium]|nr:glycosyltransferase family 4 protein [Candidatus Paceibacterota bacterium]
MTKVLINVQPLSSGHAVRGVGMYTRFLTEALEKNPTIEVFRSGLDEIKNQDITHYPFFDLFFPTLPFLKRGKTVVTIHDVIPLLFPKQYPPGKRGTLNFMRQKLALKKVDAIITDSFASKKDIIFYLGVPAEKIHVVYLAANPFLEPVTEHHADEVRKELNLPKTYVLYVGDINYNKNVPQLIKALKYLPRHVHLVCVGKNFVEQEIPEWQAITAQLALSDVTERVHFVPNILTDDYETLASIYSGALVYVQPSLYEGFGLPLLEAMRCKTPVICGKNSSLKEVGNEFVIYSGTNAEDFAENIETVLEMSETKRNKLISAASKWEKNFTWEKTATETITVYESLMAKS